MRILRLFFDIFHFIGSNRSINKPTATLQGMDTSLYAEPYLRSRPLRLGMTLVEIMVAMSILAIALPGLLYGALAGVRLNYAASQQASAFNLCLDLLEQMRGVSDYDYLIDSNFPLETLRLTHLGGSQRVALSCERSCKIKDKANPERKDINIKVKWVYLGKPMEGTLKAIIFKRQ